MTSFTNPTPNGRDDPLYAKGRGHLQRGEWEEALSAFEELQTAYPNSDLIRDALEQARLRSNVGKRRVMARQVTIRFWPIVLRIVIVAAIGYLLYTGAGLLMDRVMPLVSEARETQRLEQVLLEARTYLEAGDHEAAEPRFREILAREPENEEALAALERIEEDRLVEELYAQAVALDEAEDDQGALTVYQELDALRPAFRDIRPRMDVILRARSLAELYAQATEVYESGDTEAAIAAYEAVRDRNVNYEQELVEARLVELYVRLADGIVDQQPPNLEGLEEALAHYTSALTLAPRDAQVGRERQLLKRYLEGQAAYYAEDWETAAAALLVVYDTRPAYLDNSVLPLLYESYVRSGDIHRQNNDTYLAYQYYTRAEDLPVEDKSFVEGRLFYVRPLLTPTPTPEPTATPRPAYTGPGIATQRPLLTAYRGKIAFLGDYPNLGELWVMDPDGANKQRLGRSADLRAQFEELRDTERHDQNGDRFAFVQSPGGNNPNHQVFATIPVALQSENGIIAKQLTFLDGMTADPVWSPDGSTIAFVGSALDSDDIWIVYPDREEPPRPLNPNQWELERHPSWSPGSDLLLFWSNRNGLRQIYVMNTDGSGVANVSNTTWDAYDPIWIK